MKCSDVHYFFSQIAGRSVTAGVQQADAESLRSGGYIQIMSGDDYAKLSADVADIEKLNSSIGAEKTQERDARASEDADARRAHSIVFHLEGRQKKEAELLKTQQDEDELKRLDADISSRETVLASLIQKKSMFDKLTPYGGAFVSLTGSGMAAMNDLNVRLYRMGDTDFASYVQQMQETMNELDGIAGRSLDHFRYLSAAISEADASHRWSTSVGLAKIQGDAQSLDSRFAEAYNGIERISRNVENRLMAAEVLTSSGVDLSSTLPALFDLDHDVRHRGGVPKELSAGISSILFFGRRHDGTFPLDALTDFSRMTSSWESAAIMSIVNVPADDIKRKFMAMRSLFSSWGFQLSEDTELSSAYLAVSDLPPEGFQTKLTIITEGLKHYLEYPLVAAAILAAIPVMEANETLNLLEKAYSVIGSRATGLEQSELIGLAVRMIHGIRNELVRNMDSTARIADTPVQFTYAPYHGFMPMYVPVMVAHSSYYSTFSGIGGVHPGHIHAAGGFQG